MLKVLENLAAKLAFPEYLECGPVELFVMQPTPFCNISCTYCYLSDKSNTKIMTRDILKASAQRLACSSLLGDSITIVWHAGEPLVLPVSFYLDATQIFKDALPDNVNITHSFQTNATLITEDWVNFFKSINAQIGISIDGPAEINDAHRVTRKGKGTTDSVLNGIRLLKQQNVPFHTISVVTRSSLNKATAIFDFLANTGAHTLCFNVDEQEGVNKTSSLTSIIASTLEQDYRNFLTEIRKKASKAKPHVSIRELDSIDAALANFNATLSALRMGISQQTHPFKIINVDVHGDISTFCPEFLGVEHTEYKTFSIGNVLTDSFEDAHRSTKLKNIHKDILLGINACKSECSYFKICGGGTPSNKYFENGSMATTETQFCRLVRKAAVDEALDFYEKKKIRTDTGL